MQYYARWPSENTEIITEIPKALNGEYHAIHCYEQLANQAPSNELKNRILEIRNDEIRHYQMFAQIYTSLTGQCPNNFKDGIHAAFIDEQETVDFYHDVARNTRNSVIKDAFTQASADEQNHAVWFLYFMNNY